MCQATEEQHANTCMCWQTCKQKRTAAGKELRVPGEGTAGSLGNNNLQFLIRSIIISIGINYSMVLEMILSVGCSNTTFCIISQTK
jgi:hypothetical protein